LNNNSRRMSSQKSVALTREEQKEAYNNAEDLVRSDFSEDITHGEVVKILAQAYTGNLEEMPDA